MTHLAYTLSKTACGLKQRGTFKMEKVTCKRCKAYIKGMKKAFEDYPISYKKVWR